MELFPHRDVAPIRGILNGLHPAVVALICSAGLGFVILSLWNSETVPQDFKETLDWRGIVLLAGAFIAVRMKVKVIKLLVFSGVAGLILGLIAERL